MLSQLTTIQYPIILSNMYECKLRSFSFKNHVTKVYMLLNIYDKAFRKIN